MTRPYVVLLVIAATSGIASILLAEADGHIKYSGSWSDFWSLLFLGVGLGIGLCFLITGIFMEDKP